jgi:hypothetical protein
VRGTEIRPGEAPNDVGQRTTGTVTRTAAFADAAITQHAVVIAASKVIRTLIARPSVWP